MTLIVSEPAQGVSALPRSWYQARMRIGTFRPLALLDLFLGCGPSQSPESTTPAVEARPIDESSRPAKVDKLRRNCQSPEYVVSLEAKSAFERAEKFYEADFLPFKIRKPLKTKEQANRVLSKLIELSKRARQNYLEIAKYGQTEWAIPAQVRIGDVFHFQGRKIIDMPIPPEIMSLDAKYPEKGILRRFREAIDTQAFPLLKQGRSMWTKGVKAGEALCIDDDWTRLARDRLAANKEPAASNRRRRDGTSTRDQGRDENVKSPEGASSSSEAGRKTAVLSIGNEMTDGPSVTCPHGGSVVRTSGDYDAKLVRKDCKYPGASGEPVAGPLLLLDFDSQIVARAERKKNGEIHSCQLLKPELLPAIRSSRFRAIATACEK